MSLDPRRELILPVVDSFVDEEGVPIIVAPPGQMAKPAVSPLGIQWAAMVDGLSGAQLSIAALDGPISDTTPMMRVAASGFLYDFDAGTFSPHHKLTASAAQFGEAAGIALVSDPPCWSINHTPAANTRATITRAAGGEGVRHFCASISATLCALTAAVETTVQLQLRNGASGVGPIVWAQTLQVIPGRMTQIEISGLRIGGADETAMTLEFSAAGGADTFQSVALTGWDRVG